MSVKARLAATLLSASWLVARGAAAQPMPGGPAPYSPWDGSSALPTAPAEATAAPTPLERDPDWGRRTVELVPEVGFSVPRCASRARARAAACSSLQYGRFAGLGALYRPNPYFAFGGGFLVTEFAGPDGATARALELGATTRVYLLESGRVEPYFELWLGGGTERTQPATEPKLERHAASAGARVGGGIDFYLGEHVRLGPSLGAAQFMGALGENELAGSYFVSARLSFVLGSRL